MANPLAMTASVAGLITLAAHMSGLIYNFLVKYSDTPEYAQDIKAEVVRIKVLLEKLSSNLLSNSDRHLIYGDVDVIRALAECVLVFLSAEEFVERLVTSQRKKWLMMEADTIRLVERARRFKDALEDRMSPQSGQDGDCHSILSFRSEDYDTNRYEVLFPADNNRSVGTLNSIVSCDYKSNRVEEKFNDGKEGGQ